MILTNDEALAKKFNSAIFPGIQGGPLMHVIAAKAVAFGEALRPEFKDYQAQVIANAQALADQLMKGGLDIVTGGTDSHLMLVDLRPKGVKGNATEKALGRAHITCNKNGIPFDTEKPTITSGHPAGHARRHHARLRRGRVPPDRRLDRRGGGRAAANGDDGNAEVEAKVKGRSAGALRALPDLSRHVKTRAQAPVPAPPPAPRRWPKPRTRGISRPCSTLSSRKQTRPCRPS